VELASSYQLRKFASTIVPKLVPFMDGVSVNLRQALTISIQRALHKIDPQLYQFLHWMLSVK
jgi:hypothetical protein